MVRFACLRSVVLVSVCLGGFAPRAVAQEVSALPAPSLRQSADAAVIPALPAGSSVPAAATEPRRPGALIPLYVSFGALQALDTHSTARALARGAVEANPLMKGIAHSELGMLAVKAAGTTGVVYVSEKMWRKNKAAAIVFMIAANGAMAWVVQRNYRAVR